MHLSTVLLIGLNPDFPHCQVVQLSFFIFLFSGRRRLRHIEIPERENRQWNRRNRRGIPLVNCNLDSAR